MDDSAKRSPASREGAARGNTGRRRDVPIAAKAVAAGGIASGRLEELIIGAAVGLIAILLTRGPDLELPKGAVFQMILQQPLRFEEGEIGGSRARFALKPVIACTGAFLPFFGTGFNRDLFSPETSGHNFRLSPAARRVPGACPLQPGLARLPTARPARTRKSPRPSHYITVRADVPAGQPLSHEELLLEELERLSAAIAARENELRRLKTEVELRDLYIQELHAQLRRQAERLEEMERRVREFVPRAIPASRAAGA